MNALARLAQHIKKVVSFILLINVSLFGGGATAMKYCDIILERQAALSRTKMLSTKIGPVF